MGTSLGVSSRQGRSFGPSRCKMGTSPGARSPSVVVDDDRSTNNHDQGTRRGSTARARTLHQGNKRTGLDSPLPFSVHRVQKKEEEALFFPRAQREEPPSPRANQSEATNRPCSSPFITRVCKYPDHRGQVGGATLAHWSGGKEACISPDPDICTRGSAIFPSTKSLEGDSAAPLGVVLQQEEEEDEAMVCGCRKMAAV